MRGRLDPHALASRQIGINEVEQALRNWNVNTPTGSIIGPHKAFTLQATVGSSPPPGGGGAVPACASTNTPVP